MVIYDADPIVNLEEQQKEKFVEGKRITSLIKKDFFTEKGRELAREVHQADYCSHYGNALLFRFATIVEKGMAADGKKIPIEMIVISNRGEILR